MVASTKVLSNYTWILIFTTIVLQSVFPGDLKLVTNLFFFETLLKSYYTPY